MWDDLPGLVAHAETIPGTGAGLRSATDKVFSAGADVAEYRANAGVPNGANHTRVTAATQAGRRSWRPWPGSRALPGRGCARDGL
jgi:enoyl-CoA hydratase/carnithine racemase